MWKSLCEVQNAIQIPRVIFCLSSHVQSATSLQQVLVTLQKEKDPDKSHRGDREFSATFVRESYNILIVPTIKAAELIQVA